jgi:putative ABC transport system permease protein
MFRNYLKTAFRNLRKNKLYSAINLIGLTTGIACCVLIGLYIANELSYDKFHSNGGRIARITMEYTNGSTVNRAATTGCKVGPQFKRIFPVVEDYARTFKFRRVVRYEDKQFSEKRFLYADASFFKIFSFPLVKGDDASGALSTNDKIVITESAAKKYFGTTDPIGKTVRISDDKDFIVSAVAKDVPGNSQIQFDFVVNFYNLEDVATEQWWMANYITYFLLHDDHQLGGLQQQISAYMKTDAIRKDAEITGSNYLTYHLEPLTSVHLHSPVEGFEPNGSITYIYVLAMIALLILMIACVNYTNLAIAQSAGRNAEIGIRKVMGAVRAQLFTQFIGESLLITFMAIVLAVFISVQVLPLFNTITGKHLSSSSLLSLKPLVVIAMSGVLISLIAGAYPAFVLSGPVIIKILKTGFSFSSRGSGLKKSLIVVQFAISLFLIITTIVILQQIYYIHNKNLGYNKEHIVVLPMDYKAIDKYDGLKQQVSLLPGVKGVSGAYDLPTFIQWNDGFTANNGKEEVDFSAHAIPVDMDFIKTLNMQLVAGTDFTPADLLSMDTSNDGKNSRYTFILNETAVKKIGWTPQEAIGKTVAKGRPGTVKAVVKDFHFASMHTTIDPLAIFLDKSYVRNIFIKIQASNVPALITQLEKIWKDRVPNRPFEYHFLDDDYDNLYIAEQRTADVFTLFAGVAILLACLGLFGLAAFTSLQRTKELGIRKVLGAGLSNIVMLVTAQFLKLVAIAFVIAVPLGWLAANRWLQDFVYRINISWWIFPAAGIAVLFIALLTVGYHALKAALVNPVKSLRNE